MHAKRPMLAGACLIIGLIAVSVALSARGSVDGLPRPGMVAGALIDELTAGTLRRHVLASLERVAAGYLAAVLIGVPIGALMVMSPLAGRVLRAPIELLRPISPVAWTPLVILFLGVSDTAMVVVIGTSALWPIVLATESAIASVSPVFVQAGLSFGLSRAEIAWRIQGPAALPRIVTGLRVGLGAAWMVLVAAEMLGAEAGLGYVIVDARNAGQEYRRIAATMVVIGLIGLALDVVMRRVGDIPGLRWSRSNAAAASPRARV